MKTTTPPGPLEAEIRARCAQLADFLVAKNRAYGNSAADPLRVFSKLSPLAQIHIRMDDKISRIARGQRIEETDETVDDTKRDLAGYLVLEAVIGLKNAWCDAPPGPPVDAPENHPEEHTAYLVVSLDPGTSPWTVVGAGIYGEETPTQHLRYVLAVVMRATRPTFLAARAVVVEQISRDPRLRGLASLILELR